MESLIRKLSQRDALTTADREQLEKAPFRERVVPAGSDLVPPYARPTESCLLLDGFAARYHLLSEAGRQISAFHIAGDFVDLHGLLLRQLDHGIVALTACRAVYVPHRYLREITENNPHLTRLLWLNTLIDAAIHRQWLVAMGRKSALAHMAQIFCEMYLRLQVVGLNDGDTFPFPLTQEQLGDAMGFSVVHVNRTLKELREMQLIEWRDQKVRIQNWERLTSVAQFDPTYLHLSVESR